MRILSVLALIAAVALCALAGADPAAAGSSYQELKPLPAIKLRDLDGKPVSSDKLKGSIVVLDFWATWCGPCIVEIPHYNKLQEKYASRGVKVVGVTLASGEAKEVKPFVSKHNMKYSVYMGDDGQAYDFNVIAFPTTYLVTSDWKIYKRYIGASPHKSRQIEADLEKLLEFENRRKQAAGS
ncbi:MAG TPA: TlpA disulfide reductase family protein [Blastocatellia bacterium]|nr:TlpA disulfide reductase family protein [Blastocatellia bacterium]